MADEKECTRCHQVKTLDQFRSKKRNKDGKSSWCKTCATAHTRKYRESRTYPTPEPFVPRPCSTCGVVKDRDGYWPVKGCRDGHQLQCKRCKHMWTKYGINSAEYDLMLAEQGSLCAICEKVMESPNIDHCHETGKVRGLLCGPCNRGIGLLQDEPKLLRSAALYLEGVDRLG